MGHGDQSIYTPTALLPYVGFVASRGHMPEAFSKSFFQTMNRTRHVAMDEIRRPIQLLYTNTCKGLAAEMAPGWTSTICASIEWPIGTARRVTFEGDAAGSIGNGELLISDQCQLTDPIPRGAVFYVRTYQKGAGGIVWAMQGLNREQQAIPHSGEWFTHGVTTTDYTGSPTNVNNSVARFMYGPLAIIGQTSRQSFYLSGDSRMLGQGDNKCAISGYGGLGSVPRNLIKKFACFNGGIAAETLASATENGAGFAIRKQLYNYCSAVICEYGINDCSAGTPHTTTISNLQAFAKLFGNKPFIQCTLEPHTRSTDGFGTVANQTIHTVCNDQRVPFNEAVRSGLPSPFMGYIDIADVMESSRNSGFWKPASRSATDVFTKPSSTIISSLSQYQFSSADVGTTIAIAGAGVGGSWYAGYITNVISATHAEVLFETPVGVSNALSYMTWTADGLHPGTYATKCAEASSGTWDALIPFL